MRSPKQAEEVRLSALLKKQVGRIIIVGKIRPKSNASLSPSGFFYVKTNTKTQSLSLCLSLFSFLCLSASLPLSPSCPVMCSGQTLWLLGVSGMIIEREAREDIPLLFMSLEPSVATPIRSISVRSRSGVRVVEGKANAIFVYLGGGGVVMSRFWLRGGPFELTLDQLIGSGNAFVEMIS